MHQDAEGQVEELGATFALENEDHTLANALRYFLNKKCDQTSARTSACNPHCIAICYCLICIHAASCAAQRGMHACM